MKEIEIMEVIENPLEGLVNFDNLSGFNVICGELVEPVLDHVSRERVEVFEKVNGCIEYEKMQDITW